MLIQCVALESFVGCTGEYVAAWKRYIALNRHRLRVRFVKALRFPCDLRQSTQAAAAVCLQLNEADAEAVRSAVGGSAVWSLAAYAEHQDAFNEFGAVNNPYLPTPLFFTQDVATDGHRLWHILLGIAVSGQEYEKSYAVVDRLLRLKTTRWVGVFGRCSHS